MSDQIRDAREREQAITRDVLDALRQQREFLRQILDINPHLIFAKDREGRFTLVNQAIADIYGTTVEELIGKTDADFNPNPEQVAFFRRIDIEVMDSRKERVIPEEIITDAAGKTHWLQTVKRPIIGPDGIAHQLLGVATDITQRKNLEEQLRQSQKMEALGQLAGGIAHDFNNMLAVILGNAERLLQRANRQEGKDGQLTAGLELIVSSGERAALLVRQLLAFSRKQPMSPVVLDLNRVIGELTDLLQRLLGESIRLTVVNTACCHFVRADPSQVEQVFMNLAVNARDAMPDGGTLSLSMAEVCIDVAVDAPHPEITAGRYVRISVADTGIGMSEEIVGRIFEPFFTTKPMGKGTGLGLSMVYGIVKQLGGHITVQTSPGRGARFDVYLPCVDAGPSVSTALPDGAALRGSETVLLCEDETDVLNLARMILEDHGYRVHCAEHGKQALRLAEQFDGPIHLLVTDVVMPEMNGRELAESVLALRPNTRVLYMTGYSAEVLEPTAGQAGTRLWVAKPFTSQTLLQHVRAALDG